MAMSSGSAAHSKGPWYSRYVVFVEGRPEGMNGRMQ